MENLKLYEAFGKGSANAVNPLFKKNFIDMATNAFGYTMRGEKLTKDVDGVKCTVNTRTLEEDSFDLDYADEEFAGGSYNIYQNGIMGSSV